MLEIVLDEQKIIDAALIDKIVNDNPAKTLKVLIKYYYLQGMIDKISLKEQLLYFMEENYVGYKRSKWEKSVDGIVARFLKSRNKYKTEVKLTNIKSVNITQSELEAIAKIRELVNLDDLTKKNLEKICFIMLIYAKLSNQELDSKESWINKSCSVILKEAKVNLVGDERKRIFYQLYHLKYISQSAANDKTSMKINYIDIEEESEVAITIDSFEGVIYYYLNWKGENWKKCEVNGCNKYFKTKNNKQLYCSPCSKEKQKEWNREYMRKARNVEL